MPNISISVTEHEKKQMEDYAEMYGASISDTLKALFFDRLKDDEEDFALLQEYEANPDKTTYTPEEVKKRLRLHGL